MAKEPLELGQAAQAVMDVVEGAELTVSETFTVLSLVRGVIENRLAEDQKETWSPEGMATPVSG